MVSVVFIRCKPPSFLFRQCCHFHCFFPGFLLLKIYNSFNYSCKLEQRDLHQAFLMEEKNEILQPISHWEVRYITFLPMWVLGDIQNIHTCMYIHIHTVMERLKTLLTNTPNKTSLLWNSFTLPIRKALDDLPKHRPFSPCTDTIFNSG